MSPGRELDMWVAQKVMGLQVVYPPMDQSNWEPLYNYGDYVGRALPYSTDLVAAWEVVEKSRILRNYGLYEYDGCWVLQDHSERIFCEGNTAPHAICLAALKAVGVDVK